MKTHIVFGHPVALVEHFIYIYIYAHVHVCVRMCESMQYSHVNATLS
jgi:hypothetical protein